MDAVPQILFAPMEQILVSGGDARTAVDPQTGLNSFGCAPRPRPESLSFGSSTASSISTRAFCHAEAERAELLGSAFGTEMLEAQTERLRGELKRLLGLSQSGAEIVFSPSGTDSALHALFLARVLGGATPVDCIVLASDETGSGVPHALSGRHFSTVTAEGVAVNKGALIGAFSENVTLLSLPMRDAQGGLRPAEMREREVFETVSRSISAGRRVLLQVMDSSKLGERSPGSDCLQTIQSRFGDAVQIVVDACQMRISLTRLQWHLAQGHMVLISGSKFFTGPPFSGALLVPSALSAQIEEKAQVPSGLQDYSGRGCWPRAWTHIRAALPDRANFGQYFRWVAALEEMRAYFSIPLDFRRFALDKFSRMTTELLCSRYPDLLLIDAGESSADGIDDAEMAARTIFPFCLRQGDDWMSFEDVTLLYRSLNQDGAASLPAFLSSHEKALASKLCHIGQPVRVSMGNNGSLGAVRICASARTVTEVWSRYQRDLSAVRMEEERADLITILQKIALLSRAAHSLSEASLAA